MDYTKVPQQINDVVGDNVALIDSGKETARYAAKLIKENRLCNPQTEKGYCEFYVSDHIEGFSKMAKLFLGDNFNKDVHQINIAHF